VEGWKTKGGRLEGGRPKTKGGGCKGRRQDGLSVKPLARAICFDAEVDVK